MEHELRRLRTDNKELTDRCKFGHLSATAKAALTKLFVPAGAEASLSRDELLAAYLLYPATSQETLGADIFRSLELLRLC